MKYFYIVTNTTKETSQQLAIQIKDYLEMKGKACVIAKDEPGRVAPDNAECVIVLGGDGTVLRAARETLDRNLPILGINVGTVGYLTEVDRESWQESIDQVLAGEFTLEERMLLEGRMEDGSVEYALNDIVFTRRGQLRIFSYDIYINGQFLNKLSADGVILATPTGSTAYNLSAGGPIIEPSARMILMTPICPHSLNSRSVILSPDDIVTVRIGKTSSAPVIEADANFDGGTSVQLKTGDEVHVRTSSRTTRLIRLSHRSFMETLHNKMYK
ncbi:MAG: NAD(+)/NADH kinase [Lachnospiraceae bacterium]|nr:NAD(+)/NADH kinase [Lachnospiraceae bacterium]